MFHELGHIENGDFGISFEKEKGEEEEKANDFAESCLIPPKEYYDFTQKRDFSVNGILKFAEKINRDPGIILGRLQKEKIIGYDKREYNSLRRKYIFHWK